MSAPVLFQGGIHIHVCLFACTGKGPQCKFILTKEPRDDRFSHLVRSSASHSSVVFHTMAGRVVNINDTLIPPCFHITLGEMSYALSPLL